MRYSLIRLSILGLLVVGCDKQQEAPAAPVAPKAEAPDVAAPIAQTPAVKAEVPPAATPPAELAKAQVPADAAATSAAATADAQSKLDLAMQYIKDKKFDLADKVLAELDAH